MPKLLSLLTRAALGTLCAALALPSFAQTRASLATETAARLAPDDNAAVLRVLPAGSEVSSANAATELPVGWQAVTLDGPFTLYVRNGDIDKGLAIKPASPLYLEPDNAAAVVAYAEEGDSITITGLRGRWTQIELQKPLTAYVSASDVTARSNAAATTLETKAQQPEPPQTASVQISVVESPEPPKLISEPVAQPEPETTAIAEPEAETPEAPAVVDDATVAEIATVALSEGEGSAAASAQALPARAVQAAVPPTPDVAAQSASATPQAAYKPALTRSQLQGKLVSTRRRFAPRRPYDWQLNAKLSFRVAYLDFSRMQGTDQLARYAGQQVVVYGLVSPLGDGQYVMEVESIRLQ